MSGRTATTTAQAKPATLPIAARRHSLVREVDRQLARCGLIFSPETADGFTGCHGQQPTRVGRASVNGDSVNGHSIEEEVKVESLRTPHHASRPLTKVIIGVSGGADSVALLLACIALRHRRNRQSMPFEPVVVHVHHHLRDAADADAAWVESLCGRFDIECRVEHVHPAAEKGNTYANARRLRYAAFAKVADQIGMKHVLVAHHAEDQLETMLMSMCRGAGPRGLAGMRMSRTHGELMLIRPLLQVRKTDCEEMCRKAEIEWREDASNKDVSKRRARLRRDVLPVLEELWPGAAKRAAKGAMLMREQRRV